MHTFFNLKIRETNEHMRREIKSHVKPFLKEQGWQGKGVFFKRIRNGQHQTLTFQFDKWGGGFAVNLAAVEPVEKFYSANSARLKTIRSQRLAARNKRLSNKRNMDHWFKFMVGVLIYIPAYKSAASEFIKIYLEEADLTFNDMQESINFDVARIHLSSTK